jgi:hypothetical protein
VTDNIKTIFQQTFEPTFKPTQCFLFFFHRTFFKTIFERQPPHTKLFCIFANPQADTKNAKEFALAYAPKPTHHPTSGQVDL